VLQNKNGRLIIAAGYYLGESMKDYDHFEGPTEEEEEAARRRHQLRLRDEAQTRNNGIQSGPGGWSASPRKAKHKPRIGGTRVR